MAITYSSPNGTQITSHAMTETLGSQTQQTGNNTVIVSDVLSVIGGGQIGDGSNGVGDTYAGRLLIIDQGLSTEQVRKCTADAAGTGTTRILTVSEDWDTNPVATTDTIHVPYELADIEDGGAGGGINLNTKSGLWEFSNRLRINSGGGLAVLDGAGHEMDDRGSTVSFEVQSGGYFYAGYARSGADIAGIQMTTYNNTAGEPCMQVQSGGTVRMFDTLIWGQLVAQKYECANGSDAEFRRCKWLSVTQELHLYDAELVDCSAAGRGGASEILRVDPGTVIDGLVLADVQVLDSVADTVTETIELEGVLFAGVPGYVDVRQNKTWNLIDPVWDVTTYTQLTWTGTSTGNELNDRRAIKATVQKADGTKLQDALVNVYENTQLADLVLELTTDANGYAEDSFIYKKHATNSVTTTYGGHALQVGKWLYVPLVFTQVSTARFEGTIVLAPDSNIVQTTQATAITAGAGVTWNEDTNASELFDFTSGSGTHAVGMILTFSPSGAVGTTTELLDGDSTAGTIHLKDRNATAIANGDTFSRTGGTAGTFSGTYTNASKQPFAIWIDGNSLSYQTLYDYLAARQTETTLAAVGELIWEWCRDTQTQALYATGSSFYAERSSSKGLIIVNGGSGTLDYFTDDAGTTWVPPATATLKVTVSNQVGTVLQGINVRFQQSDETLISEGSTDASGIFSYGQSTGDLPFVNAKIIARRKDFEDKETTLTIPVEGFDIPISMQPDIDVDLP